MTAYQMPPRSFALGSSVALNSFGQIAFSTISVEGRPQAGLWYGNSKGGKIVREIEGGSSLSDPSMNSLGQITYEIFDDLTSTGIFSYDPANQKHSQLIKPKEIFDLNFMSYPFLSASQSLFFLGSDSNRKRSIVLGQNGRFHQVKEQGQGCSYIFSPSYSESGFIASKVRLGDAGEWSEDRPDQILLWTPEGKSLVIAEDRQARADSPFEGFGNSLSVSSRGDVIFRAELDDAKTRSALVLYSHAEQTLTTIIDTNHPDLGEIEHFTPRLNSQLQVVFRGKNKAGLRCIYLLNGASLNGASLNCLIREGDQVPSDLGPVNIFFDKDNPGFGGSPALNERGQIAFLTTTVIAGLHNQTYSKAIYLLDTKDSAD